MGANVIDNIQIWERAFSFFCVRHDKSRKDDREIDSRRLHRSWTSELFLRPRHIPATIRRIIYSEYPLLLLHHMQFSLLLIFFLLSRLKNSITQSSIPFPFAVLAMTSIPSTFAVVAMTSIPSTFAAAVMRENINNIDATTINVFVGVMAD